MSRSLLRATISPLRPARERIAWCMVGTAVIQVGFTASSQPKYFSPLNPGVQHTCAPARSEASVAAMRPWMWKSGMMLRQTSPGASDNVRAMFPDEAITFRCSSGTILGRAVVPEVCRTSAMSPASPRPGLSAVPRIAPSGSSVNAPAPCARSGRSSTTARPSFSATSREGEAMPCSTTSAFARRSVR